MVEFSGMYFEPKKSSECYLSAWESRLFHTALSQIQGLLRVPEILLKDLNILIARYV